MSLEKSKRPLSPHLQVYKPQMTSMLSILHRMTGVALVLGMLLVAALLIGAGIGEQAYNQVVTVTESWFGQLALFGFAFSLIFHTLNGVRHLIWDTGRLFKIEDATRAGYLVFWGAVILTGALWFSVQSNALNTVTRQCQETCTSCEERRECLQECSKCSLSLTRSDCIQGACDRSIVEAATE